jgi:parallel beta-helix repeat protein
VWLWSGITVNGRHSVSIAGGTIRNFLAGVLVRNSTAVVVKDDQLIANGDGVDLQAGSVANTIKANQFQDNLARGIMSRSFSSANTIKDNTFTGNRVGLLLFGATDSTVKDNTLSLSVLADIRINVIAANNLIQENTVTSSPAGIEFLVTPAGSSIGNTLRENTIALNTCGLKGPTSGNTLTENVFEANASDTCS